MKLLIVTMAGLAALSMAIFVGAFQACTNQTSVTDDSVMESTELGEDTSIALDVVNVVDGGVLEVVTTEELDTVTEEVEVIEFTEEETADVFDTENGKSDE